MEGFDKFLDWYDKTIEHEMKLFYRDILYSDKALYDLFSFQIKPIRKYFNALIEDYPNDHEMIGESFHKGFRQLDLTEHAEIDSSIWYLLSSVGLFWKILHRFNNGDEAWDDDYI